MHLTPRDLGTKWHIALVRYRAIGTARLHTLPQVGRLGRLWAQGLDVPEEVVAATLPLIADTSGPLVWGLGTGIVLAAAALIFAIGLPLAGIVGTVLAALFGLYACIVLLPRRKFHRFHQAAIRWDELEALKGKERKAGEGKIELSARPLVRLFQSIRGGGAKPKEDELERVYLSLVQDALSLQNLSVTAETEVKRVIRALGDAIGAVPAIEAEGEDMADVLTDAEMLAARATRESDKVVAESLLRQADAHVSRAKAMENNRRLGRRTKILRDELLSQVKAVRSVLPHLGSDAASAATDFSRFATLSADVQSIANEAASVADAREELAQALRPYRSSVETEETPVYVQAGQRR
jgi:hypothetical protein